VSARPVAVVAVVAVALAGCTSVGATGERPAAPSQSSPDGAAQAAASPTRTPRPSPSPESESTLGPSPTAVPVVRGEPDAERAVRLATLLARDIGPRPAGGAADAVARTVTRSWLTAAGWQVAEQPVPLPQGGETANLVATWQGRGADGPHVVIGAHLDTVADSPGANDNGSGVGALVVLADELADEAADLPVPVVLVVFGAEEYQASTPRIHHLGSDVYAEARGDDVLGMVSVDMVANGPTTCICRFDVGPRTLADRLAALAPAGGGYEARAAGDVSDHGPFARRGIPAAFLWSGWDAGWHSPGDTHEHLQVDDLARSLRLVAAFVRSLGEDDLDGLGP
jgi:acetylornithine deacetylase/succinyl-diaminopimelate desuccinylase-like protein